MQYVPENGLYVYFRYDENQTIMCIMNTGSQAAWIDFKKYQERIDGFIKAKKVIGNQVYSLNDKPEIETMQMWVLELSR